MRIQVRSIDGAGRTCTEASRIVPGPPWTRSSAEEHVTYLPWLLHLLGTAALMDVWDGDLRAGGGPGRPVPSACRRRKG